MVNISRGKSSLKLLNTSGYDFMSTGNIHWQHSHRYSSHRNKGWYFLAVDGDSYELFKAYPTIGEFGTYKELFADYLQCDYTGIISTGRIIQNESTQTKAA